MEKKTFRFVKNMLWPFKTTLEIGSDGITSGGKYIRWDEVEGCVCHVNAVNGGMNYIAAIDDKNKKSIYLNYVHNMFASKKKKAMFSEIYDMIIEGLYKNHIQPKSDKMFEEIQSGKEMEIEKIKVNSQGVEITKGMMKKEQIMIPYADMELQFPDGTGGFRIVSKSNPKDFQHIFFAGLEARYLLAVMEKMIPESAVAK